MARCGARDDAFRRCIRNEGHEGDHKAPRPKGTTLRNVRIDDERWTALLDIAKEHGLKDRSELIRAWIDGRVMPPPPAR